MPHLIDLVEWLGTEAYPYEVVKRQNGTQFEVHFTAASKHGPVNVQISVDHCCAEEMFELAFGSGGCYDLLEPYRARGQQLLSSAREGVWRCAYRRLCRHLRRGLPLKDLASAHLATPAAAIQVWRVLERIV
jgi:hypothetical protein